MNANVDRLYDILGELPEFEGLGTVKACLRAAEALDRAGVVVSDYEYRLFLPYSAQPTVIADHTIDTMFSSANPASHRRRVLRGQKWEPIPDGETHEAGSLTFTADGKP